MNHPNHANQNPVIQVLVWDQTQNNVGTLLMNNIINSAFQLTAGNNCSIIIQSPLGPLEVNYGGWSSGEIPLRPGVTRFYVVLTDGPQFNIDTIDRRMPGTFQLNFKHLI